MRSVLVLNGPNLNLLGTREPEVYGRETLDEVVARLVELGSELQVRVEHFQSNSEGALVDRVQLARTTGVAGAVVNAGGYTHSSVALRDALLGTALPFVEVHVSNVYRREAFRHRSLLADAAVGLVVGLGTTGYDLALRGLVAHLARHGL